MSFVRRSANALKWTLALLVIAAVATSALLSGSPAAIPIAGALGWAAGIALGAAVTLPVVALLLVRAGRQSDRVDSSWRLVAIALAPLLVAIGALGFAASEGVWRIGGGGLVALGIAGLILAATMPAPAGRSRRFGITGVALVLTFLGAFVGPYFGDSRARAYRNAVRSDLRNAQAQLEDVRGSDPTELPPLETSERVTVTRERGEAGWQLAAVHQVNNLRCTLDVPDRGPVPAIDCGAQPGIVGKLTTAWFAGAVLLLLAGLPKRAGSVHGNRMRWKPASGAGVDS